MRNDRSRTLALLAAILLFGAGLGSRAAAQAEVPAKIRAPERTTPETQGSPASAALGYWQRLTAGATESAAIVWNRQNGAAESIFGTFSGPGPASEAAARQFLRDNAPLFGMPDDLHELQTSGTLSSPMGHHLLFRQSYQGVPVYAAEAAVHFNKQGRIVAVNSSYQPDIFISVAPTIDLAAAMREATRALRTGDFSQASGALVVYRYASAYVLAWQITVPTSDETWELFVDAQAGGVLGEPRDINRYVTGTGQVFLDNAVVATQNNLLRDNKDAASAVPQSAYATVTLQGLAGTNLLDGIYASSSKTKKRTSGSNNNFVFTRDKLGFSETMGYYYIDYAERYIQTLGFTNVNNRQQVFSANGTAQDNSFYSPSTKQITYGTGGVDDAEDAEVILHEYGHAIQDNQKPGFGSGVEAGAMGEGFGDYWGASVTAHFSGGFQDVCVAEWDATSYSSTDPPCLRRLDSSKHYPQSIVGEVHADGEIWSAALWQIRLALGTPSAADKVILQHHFLIPASASFNTAANALVTAAINLGFKATDVSTMREILRNRGFTVTI